MIKLTAAQKQYLEGNLKVWEQMTDYNEHDEVRCRIAHFLNIVTEGKAFILSSLYQNILNEHNRQGNLTKMLRNLCSSADQEMYTFIKEELGEEVYQQIYKCL